MIIRYTVKSGDILSAIAKDQLGDAKRFNEITDENLDPIKNKQVIHPKQILTLPDDFHGRPEVAGEYIVPRDATVSQVVGALYTGGSERLAKIADGIIALNDLSATEPLGVGQRLKVFRYAGLKDVPLQPVDERPVVEPPDDNGPDLSYTVQPGDNLRMIVRRVTGLTEPENSQQISHFVDQIVADNRVHIPHLTRNLIHPGDVLTMPFFDNIWGV